MMNWGWCEHGMKPAPSTKASADKRPCKGVLCEERVLFLRVLRRFTRLRLIFVRSGIRSIEFSSELTECTRMLPAEGLFDRLVERVGLREFLRNHSSPAYNLY